MRGILFSVFSTALLFARSRATHEHEVKYKCVKYRGEMNVSKYISKYGVQLTFDGGYTSTEQLIPSCGGLGKTKYLSSSVPAKPLLKIASLNSTTWMLADASGSLIRVVEITIELRNDSNLWGKTSHAWWASKGDLKSTSLLTSDDLLKKREARNKVDVVDTQDGKGYALDWFVYRFESPPTFALKDGPSEERFSAKYLEDSVQTARRQFEYYMANVSANGEGSPITEKLELNEHILTRFWDDYMQRLNSAVSSDVPFNLEHSSSDGDLAKNLLRHDLQGLAKAYVAMRTGVKFHNKTQIDDVRKFLVSTFKRLGAKGINKRGFDPKFQDQWREWGDFAFIKASDFEGRKVFNREEGGLAISTLLMREELVAANVTDPFGALHTFTSQWDSSRRNLFTFYGRRSGMNSDAGRILLHSRLWYLLSLPAKGHARLDNESEFTSRAEELDTWWAYCEKLFAVTSDMTGTVKPDGTLFHHMMLYSNDYPYEIIPLVTSAAYALRGTPWALSNSTLLAAAKAALARVVFSARGDTPRASGGRLTYSDRNAVNVRDLCPFVVLPWVSPAVDARYGDVMRAAVRRFSASYPPGFLDTRYTPPGCLRLWEAELSNSQSESSDAHISKYGSGAYIFPNAGTATFSATGAFEPGGFVAVSTGFSKFVKDSFETQGATQNAHGWYQGSGSLTILTRDGGAEPLTRGSTKADPYRSGFDWHRFPGTTNPHRPSNCSYDFKLLHPRKKYASHPNAFVGGTKSADGSTSVWGFHFEDLQNPVFSDALVATTSRFYFRREDGSSFLLCIGANITGGEPNSGSDWDNVTTNLFQNFLASEDYIPDDAYPVRINNESFSEVPFDSAAKVPSIADDPVVRIRDSVGIGYVVVGGSGKGRLRVVRANQTKSLQNCKKGEKWGKWSSAYIEHGVAPVDSKYEYVILLDSNITDNNLNSFEPSKVYSVLTASGLVHGVRLLSTNSVSLVAFGATTMPDAIRSETGNITFVSKPCAITAQMYLKDEMQKCVSFSVANPDLGYFDGGKADFTFGYSSQQREAYTRRSTPQTMIMMLDGIWDSDNMEAREVENYLLGGSGSGPGDSVPLKFNVNVSIDREEGSSKVTIVNQNGVPVQFSLCEPLTTAPSVAPSTTSPTYSPSPAPSTGSPTYSPSTTSPSQSPSASPFLSLAPSTPLQGCKRFTKFGVCNSRRLCIWKEGECENVPAPCAGLKMNACRSNDTCLYSKKKCTRKPECNTYKKKSKCRRQKGRCMWKGKVKGGKCTTAICSEINLKKNCKKAPGCKWLNGKKRCANKTS